jgi:tRNA-modifying protein YgfZ
VYAFATNVKGRIIADLNVLVLDECIWLDLDRRWVEAVLTHLNRHVITEDVRLYDLSSQTCRVAAVGPQTGDLARQLGFGDFDMLRPLQHAGGRAGGKHIRMVRHDFAGLPAAEFVIGPVTESSAEAEKLQACEPARKEIAAAAAELGLTRLDGAAVEILRIEAGVPASVEDIDEEILPPETGQIERGIDYHKGCYLGQEIIERMRSHGALARRLVGIRVSGDTIVACKSTLRIGDNLVGHTRSCCWSEALRAVLALGYVKTANAEPGVAMVAATRESDRPATVVELPVRPR